MLTETLAAAEVTEFAVIADLLVILASAAVVAIAMQRIRLAVIPAYLITGAVIGPHALGLVPSPEGLGDDGPSSETGSTTTEHVKTCHDATDCEKRESS